jgi:hypothetical protein
MAMEIQMKINLSMHYAPVGADESGDWVLSFVSVMELHLP